MGVLKSIFLDSIRIHDKLGTGEPGFRRSSRDHGNLVGENGRRADQIVRLAKPEDGKGVAEARNAAALSAPYADLTRVSITFQKRFSEADG